MEIRAKVMPLMSNSLLTFYYSSLELNYEFLINKVWLGDSELIMNVRVVGMIAIF